MPHSHPYQISAQFIQLPANTLKYEFDEGVRQIGLPFVSNKNSEQRSCWQVPATGGYTGGNQTGDNLAYIYLKHLRETRGEASESLSSIFLDMARVCQSETPESITIRGQIISFLSVIEDWVSAAAVRLGDPLDVLDSDILLQEANYGLNYVGQALKDLEAINNYDDIPKS